jgi:Protein of unknown function (DUF2489)
MSAVATANAIILGKIGLIQGCIRLASLAHNLVPDWRIDQDFVIVGGIASETDDLPTGSAREHWSQAALDREDKKIAEYETRTREVVLAACRNIVTRFATRN